MTVIDDPEQRHADLGVPSRTVAVARRAATAIGGPLGRRADQGVFTARPNRRGRQPVGLLVVLALMVMLAAWFQKLPCHDGFGNPGYSGNDYAYSRLCYSDVYALYGAEGLADRKVPYVDHAVEYPVGIGAIMAVAAAVTQLLPGQEYTVFFDVNALLLTLCCIVVVLTTGWLAGRRRWFDAVMVVVSPVMVLHGLINWDLAAVALLGLAMLAWARERPLVAGALIGLGTITKLYPVFLLLALLPLCARTGHIAAWGRAAGAAAFAFLAVYLPVFLGSPMYSDPSTVVYPSPLFGGPLSLTSGDAVNGVYRFVQLNRERPADWDSLYYAARSFGWPTPSGSALNLVIAVLTVAWFAAVLAVAWRARRRPRVPQVLLLLVIGFLLCNKVYSPQYALWLLPLMVLARPRWWSVLVWQVAECLELFTRFYFFLGGANGSKGVGETWFVSMVVVRDLVLVGICALVVREMLQPEHDTVRALGEDDPCGGPLDRAPDLRGPSRLAVREAATATV